MNIAAVILAAGLSSRMGAFKPLIRLGGKSLLSHCQEFFGKCGLTEIIAVAGHRAEETAAEATSLGMRWVANAGYRAGMFSSIQCAVSSLPKDIDAFFILPVDIPLIRTSTIRTILAAFQEDDTTVLYPVFAGSRGHPPLIPASLISAILNHDGVGGLATLLRQHQGIEIAVWDEGILMDADTPEDLWRLERRLSRLTVPTRREVDILAGLLLTEDGLAHGRLVGCAAVAIARMLNDRGCRLDMDIVYAAALLHDVAKGQSRHEIRGAKILAALELPEIAEIVRNHRDLGPPDAGNLTEKEVVCLADKFISGTRRVRIEERSADRSKFLTGNTAICRETPGRRERALALKDLVEQRAGRSVETVLNEAGL